MAAEYELTLNDYLQILVRRKLHIAITFFVILFLAVLAALLIPPVYQSTGTILVESQQIPTDLVKATVTSYADERIAVIKQRVMTRENLYKIIDKYGLYHEQLKSDTTSEILDRMRQAILVDIVNANIDGQEGNKAVIAFKISFDYKQPELAHKVANDLVTLFLDENVKTRTARATETTEFFSEEADRLRLDLESMEAKIATFKQQNSGALPEHEGAHLAMLQAVDMDIREIDRDYKATQEELRYLDVELAASKKEGKKERLQSTSKSTDGELDRAIEELEQLSGQYSENHPTIRSLKRKIETLKAKESKGKITSVEGHDNALDSDVDLKVAKVEAQIHAAKERLATLSEQRSASRRKQNQLQSNIVGSSQVERGLATLMRDYENAKSKYEEVKSKQLNARMSQNLEQENKAERFSLIEPPLFPEKPIKPNRKKILAFGFLFAIAGAFGLVFMLESLDERIRGADALTAVIKARPLVVIPYITTNAEYKRNKRMLKFGLMGVMILVILMMLLVHFLYIPLDVLAMKILARF